MALTFPDHDDVVFRKAPLTSVLCQIRFPPILALLDSAGVAGFQEALRHLYPDLGSDEQMLVEISPAKTEIKRPAPVWKLQHPDDEWVVSVAVDFVALETSAYTHFGEFNARLSEVLAAIERTLSPGFSKRIGLRKTNKIAHPSVHALSGWTGFLKAELLGLGGVPDLPGTIARDYAEFHLEDDTKGCLSVRHGMDAEDREKYLLDLDYWTQRGMAVAPKENLLAMLKDYSDAMTGFFHWCLTEHLAAALEPVPRTEVAT